MIEEEEQRTREEMMPPNSLFYGTRVDRFRSLMRDGNNRTLSTERGDTNVENFDI